MAKAKATSTKTGRTKATSTSIEDSTTNPIAEPTKSEHSKTRVAAGATEPSAAAGGATAAEVVAKSSPAPDVKIEGQTGPNRNTKPSVETVSSPEPRRLEVVKSDPRRNSVVPINLEDEVRRRAYELYLQRGSMGGSEAEDWLRAEREIRQRYQKQQSA
jgi:Protein of unknown function (DUF2934)